MAWVACTLLCGLVAWREKKLVLDSSCDALHDGEHLDFLVLKCSGHNSLVLLWKGHKNNTFVIPDNCNHDISCWRQTVEFLRRWEKHAVPLHRLPIELEFKVLDPSFIHPWQLATTQALISYIAWVHKISSDCLLVSLYAPVSIYGIPLSPTLE
jgi:hypothetical protein